MEFDKENQKVYMNRKQDLDSSNIYTNLAITSKFGGKFNKDKLLDRESIEKYDHLQEKRNTRHYHDLKDNDKNIANVRHTQYYEEIEIQKEGTPKLCEKIELKEDIKKESVTDTARIDTTNTRVFRIGVLVQVILTLGCCGISVFVLTVVNKEEYKAGYTDNVWAAWGHWEACSVSCDVGMQIRHRNCLSAVQRQENGYLCSGSTTEYRLCSRIPCSIITHNVLYKDGSWSDWGSWGSCSVTCGQGVYIRTRTCLIPTSSNLGRSCFGDSLQVEACSTKLCTDEFVAYNVKLTSVEASNELTTMVFTDTMFNIGAGYDTTTGVFTAPTTGLYQFNGCVCANNFSNKIKYVLSAEGNQTFSGELNLQSNITECTSFGHVINVIQHGKVFIKAKYLYTEPSIVNSFSGILIHKT